MNIKNNIRLSLAIVALVGVLFILGAFVRTPESKGNEDKESQLRCPQQKNKPKMSWEGLSRQFIS